MREIKFRAWNEEKKKMHYNILDGEAVNSAHDELLYRGYPYSEPMQFTGLKDKNGKEIYEGDIVKCREYGDDKEIEINLVEDMICFHLFLSEEFSGFSSESSELEIIGNRYENPELLEVGKP